jgi:translation elongation factor EF-4
MVNDMIKWDIDKNNEKYGFKIISGTICDGKYTLARIYIDENSNHTNNISIAFLIPVKKDYVQNFYDKLEDAIKDFEAYFYEFISDVQSDMVTVVSNESNNDISQEIVNIDNNI